jgi:hypothetical protein
MLKTIEGDMDVDVDVSIPYKDRDHQSYIKVTFAKYICGGNMQ